MSSTLNHDGKISWGPKGVQLKIKTADTSLLSKFMCKISGLKNNAFYPKSGWRNFMGFKKFKK